MMMGLFNWQVDLGNPVLILVSLLILASLVLSLRAVSKRLYQRSPARAMLTMSLNLVAYTALWILVLQPMHRHQAGDTVILLTDGASSQSVTSRPDTHTYLAPGTKQLMEKEPAPKVMRLMDVGQLPLKEPALNRLEVHGYGLDEAQWRQLPADLLIDFKPPPVNGFTDMRWQRTLVSGEYLDIGGVYRSNATQTIVTVRLIDPAGNMLAEKRLQVGQDFTISVPTMARGQLEYVLQAWITEKLVSEQPVNVDVQAGKPFNIMIRQSAPSFETRQLKNYATLAGHKIIVQTGITRDKVIRQTANLPTGEEISFSPRTLARQDVLIMDGRTLAQMDARQQQWLVEAIENGLGLLVLADTALLDQSESLKAGLLQGFTLESVPDADAEVVPLLSGDRGINWQFPLPVQRMQLITDAAQTLIDDDSGRKLFAYRPKGRGHIAISLINHSDRWLTAGRQADWGDLWSSMLAAIARQPAKSRLLQQDQTMFYRVGQKAPVCALSDADDLRIRLKPAGRLHQDENHELKLAKDNLSSPRQCVFFWPQTAGWQHIGLFESRDDQLMDQQAIFVFQADQWQAQQRNQRLYASRARAAQTNNDAQPFELKWVSEPVGIFWPWLILLISASLLWVERKLHDLLAH